MNYIFTHPEFLKLLYCIPVFWLVAILGVKKLPAWRIVVSAFCRSLLFAAVVMVLSGLSLVEISQKDLNVGYMVDMSDSIDETGKQWMDNYVKEVDATLDKKTNRQLGLFSLRSQSIYESTLLNIDKSGEHIAALPIAGNGTTSLGAGRTNIENAIVSSLGGFKKGAAKRLVLLTDGNENFGDVKKAAMLAKNENVRIFTASPPKTASENKITLQKVVIPDEIPIGKTAEIKIVVENKNPSIVNGNLKLFLGKFEGSAKPALFKQWASNLLPGLNVYKVRFRPKKKGFVRFETILESNDKVDIEEKSIVNPVIITGKSKILYVNGKEGRKLFLPDALKERGIDVEVATPDQLPDTLMDMQLYKSVIFSNVSKSMIKEEQMDIIERYVRDFGGGFVMLGGENSFIQGGYSGTPIERILPVKMLGGEHKRKKERYRLALMMVIDKSASMQGKKMTFAKKAALKLVDQLKGNDKLGIIAFDSVPYTIQDLRPVPAVKVTLIGQLSKLYPGGGTNIFPALKTAYLNIINSGSKTNHVILLSDGNTEFLYYNKEALIKSFKQNNISISTIAIGRWFVNTNLLKDIAGRTGGRFYKVDDVAQLPKLIVKDVEDSLSKTDIHEEVFHPTKIADSKILKNISQAQLPPLRGYSLVTSRQGAETSLISEARGKADPILSNWRYGLGKTIAYTADAEARWSSKWIKWIKFNKFWSQALRWSMNEIPESDYSAKVEMVDNVPHLFVESFHKDELFDNSGNGEKSKQAPMDLKILLRKTGQIQDTAAPNMDKDGNKELLLRQIGPKSYISPLNETEPGAYFTTVVLSRNGKMLSRKTKGLVIPKLKPELPFDTGAKITNVDMLKEVAEITGGKYMPDINEIALNTETTSKMNSLAQFLIPFALAMLVADIALRIRQ